MKKIFLIAAFAIAYINSAWAQLDPEYDFFTLKAGFSHSLFDKQPDPFAYKMLKSPYGDLEMAPVSGYAGYTPGYHAGILFTHDMKNNLTGISIGAEYQTYGISQKYETVDQLKYTLVEHQIINTVAIPVLIKVGKKMFKNQRYFFVGLQYNINLGMTQTQEVSWSSVIGKVKMDKTSFVRKNYVGVLGFNYTIFNFEANYVFGGFVNKDYEEPMEYPVKPTVRPYESFPNGILVLKTSITMPLNPWTTNTYYLLKRKLRRWLK